ncbi:MAG: ABC transporter permease [Nitrososphaerota archaeon]
MLRAGPFALKLEPRAGREAGRLPTSVLSLALSLLAGMPLLLLMGRNPLEAYGRALAFLSTPTGLSNALALATPILLISIGLTLAFRANFWNIGAEGQLYLGAIAATLPVVLGLRGPLLLPLMLLLALGAGALWGCSAAALRNLLGMNEVLTTLMMNYLAIILTGYLVQGPWRDPRGYGFPLSPAFPPEGTLPSLPGTSLNMALPLALALAPLVALLLERTTWGFELKSVGQGEQAARYVGMSRLRAHLLAMGVSGGLSGLAGLVVVSAMVHRLRPIISPGYGYTAIIVAFLAGLNPLAAVPASLLFGALLVAGDALQASLAIPSSISLVLQALVFLFLAAGELLRRYRIRFVRA